MFLFAFKYPISEDSLPTEGKSIGFAVQFVSQKRNDMISFILQQDCTCVGPQTIWQHKARGPVEKIYKDKKAAPSATSSSYFCPPPSLSAQGISHPLTVTSVPTSTIVMYSVPRLVPMACGQVANLSTSTQEVTKKITGSLSEVPDNNDCKRNFVTRPDEEPFLTQKIT